MHDFRLNTTAMTGLVLKSSDMHDLPFDTTAMLQRGQGMLPLC